MEKSEEELRDILKQIDNVHFPSEPAYAKNHKAQSLLCKDELEKIYHLTESHAANLRFRAAYQYAKSSGKQKENLPLNLHNFNFNCCNESIDAKLKKYLNQCREMPEEWTIVQLTSQLNIDESLSKDLNKHTSPLHVTVFNCGKNQAEPFVLTLQPPKDDVSGSPIEVRQEMHDVLNEHQACLKNITQKMPKISQSDKVQYNQERYLLQKRLQNVVHVIQEKWLAGWRSLLIGKFADEKLEKKVMEDVTNMFDGVSSELNNNKNKNFIKCLVKGGDYLTPGQLKSALQVVFPDEGHKEFRISLAKTILTASKSYKSKPRHSVILVIDEKLDFFPWEMLDVLKDQPVSRMPSLHLLYALFKEHEDSIVGGYKMCSTNGTYIVNPDLDLKKMENRVMSFLKYWLPNWSGIIGAKPTEQEFQESITNYDIFLYCGHGNGTQFLAYEKIQKLKINTVVLLFGCSSVQLSSLGPQVPMYGSYEMYLIACSPCVVGMLWSVTDLATDVISTVFLSQWLPSKAKIHWKCNDLEYWAMDAKPLFSRKKEIPKSEKWEPNLLLALSKAKKATDSYFVKAACVARGLPVKVHKNN